MPGAEWTDARAASADCRDFCGDARGFAVLAVGLAQVRPECIPHDHWVHLRAAVSRALLIACREAGNQLARKADAKADGPPRTRRRLQ
jgi:hypothetical protein